MKKSLIITSMALGFLALAVGLVLVPKIHAAGGGTPQASITLNNSDAKYCYTHNNLWTLTKEVTGNTVDPSTGMGTVTWTITATKDSSGAATFTVHGGLTVTNTGSAPATIGNIVVNLQKPNSPKRGSNASYVSIAADVADATNGDAATTANIVAAGSQENPTTNAAWGTNNYTVAGAKGTFTETAGSGALEFKDASDNTVFSLVPQLSLAPGASITLLYDATFSTSVLPPAGTPLRVEALVSFGNAGGRGGSGASATNIDINGNGVIDPDEANVRTVPSRITLPALPAAPDECNDSVTVTDTGATTTGTVTTSNPTGFDAFPAVISSTTSWDVSVDVDSGTDGGTVCNEAQLEGAACGGTLNVIVGYEDPPYNTIPIYATYECAPAAEGDDSDCAQIGPPSGCSFNDNDYCTYTRAGYAQTCHSGNPPAGCFFDANYLTAFPSGLTIGVVGSTTFDATWTGNTTGRSALKTFLGQTGQSGALTADTSNATSTSGGNLASQTATLTLNIGFNAAGLHGTHTNLGYLTLCNLVEGTTIGGWTLTAAQAAALNGKTINDILTDANNALGGNGLASYYGTGTAGFSNLNELVTALNGSFDGCSVSAFATANLCCARSQTFSYTGDVQTFTVPNGITQITISAKGGAGDSTFAGGTAGRGALVTATVPVSSGATLYVYVGGWGTDGGFNGGGLEGVTSAGGGASDVRTSNMASLTGNPTTDPRVIVAGGGGSTGINSPTGTSGGNGGAVAGNGAAGANSSDGGGGGGGGTQTAGGAAGTSTSGHPGLAGVAGVGGVGNFFGSNGGGGWFGGGGGGRGGTTGNPSGRVGGGGGGSSFIVATATGVFSTAGGNTTSNDGEITISW